MKKVTRAVLVAGAAIGLGLWLHRKWKNKTWKRLI